MKIIPILLAVVTVIAFSACASKPKEKEECTTCPIKRALGMGGGQSDAQKKAN